LNIYIYGNQSFKKDIHLTLDHANIKFKLDSNSIIKDIDNLSELKDTIKQNPNDIYLIDDEKIIKKNALNQKIKFLAPKDGIEQEFLLDNNIADLSVDSLAEIPKYILKKYEQEKSLDSSIQDSIIDIVDEAYENDDKIEDLELDSELADLLAKDDFSDEKFNLEEKITDENSEMLNQDINLDKIEELISDIDISENEENEITNEEFNSIMNFDEDFGLNNSSFDYDDKNITEETESLDDNKEIENLDDLDFKDLEEFDFDEDINKDLEEFNFDEDMNVEDDINDLFDSIDEKVEEPQKGESMSDEFSELDSLSEDDILKALDGFETQSLTKVSSPAPKVEQVSEKINVSSSSVDDIAQLISRLLNNKTLEITIKIKD
jgi:hypothetical protein